MITHYDTLVGGLALAIGGIAYMLRTVRRIASTITWWTGLPPRFEDLYRAHDANTAAIRDATQGIADLTVQVTHLVRMEQARASQAPGSGNP